MRELTKSAPRRSLSKFLSGRQGMMRRGLDEAREKTGDRANRGSVRLAPKNAIDDEQAAETTIINCSGRST